MGTDILTQKGWEFGGVAFKPGFLIEVALGIVPEEEACRRHGIDFGVYKHVSDKPAFQMAVKRIVKQAEDEGFTVQYRARVLAEEAMSHLYGMAADEDIPPSERRACIERLVQYAGVESGQLAQQGNNGIHFSINYNSNTQPPPKDVEQNYGVTVVTEGKDE
jgi:hypothetical protein